MGQPSVPTENQAEAGGEQEPQRGHTRRPPLAEIDTWELWQAWQRGERGVALPWIGLLASFCLVLAAMYSFFFFSTTLSDDTVAQAGLTIVFLAFIVVLWRRISPRREFAFLVVALILGASVGGFLLWLLAVILSNWNPFVAIGGTLLLGLGGVLLGLPSLNAIARQQE